MVLINAIDVNITTILWNLLYTILIVIGFVVIFLAPAYLVNRIIDIIMKRFAKKEPKKKSISMLILYGFFINLCFTMCLAMTNLLNKTWIIYLLSSVLLIGAILVDLIDLKFNFKDYFSLWKNRFIKLKDKLFKNANYTYIIIVLVALLVVIPSFILPYPAGEDIIGHSLYLQLIFEQSALVPKLNERISPIIITSNVVQYPLFAHYIAVLNYAFVTPIVNITSPQFMNIYIKIWILALPFTIKDVGTKIFGKRFGNISFIMGFVLSPSFFVIWRWGGFAYTFGLLFFNITLFIFFNWKEYYIIEYIILSIISLFFVLISHIVVFTFTLLIYFGGMFLYIGLNISKDEKNKEILNNKKPFCLSLLISIGFICIIILTRVIIPLLKYNNKLNENPYPYNLYLGIIGLIAALFLSLGIVMLVRKNKSQDKVKFVNYFYYPFWSGIILMISTILIAVLFIPSVNITISKISLVRTLLLGTNSTTPIRDFEFIGSDNPLLVSTSYSITILLQIISNVYINGFLAVLGLVLLFNNLKFNKSNIKYKLFLSICVTVACFLLYYGLSMINALSFLAFKFPLAFFLIRYERLFITFLINLAPILSAFVISKYISKTADLNYYEEKVEDKKILMNLKKAGNFIVKNKKTVNIVTVIFISAITLGMYTYVGYFRTSLYYSNDIGEASEWILANTDKDARFIVDSYGSWITFTTERQISFAFLAGSTDIHLAVAITTSIIYKLITDTAREIIFLKNLGYEYVYLSTARPNNILDLFHSYMGYYYTFDTFNNLLFVDIVYYGETDMILYLNSSAFTHDIYYPPPAGSINDNFEFTW